MCKRSHAKVAIKFLHLPVCVPRDHAYITVCIVILDIQELEQVTSKTTINLLVNVAQQQSQLLWWNNKRLMANSPDPCRSQFDRVDMGNFQIQLRTPGPGGLYLSVNCDQRLPVPEFTLQTVSTMQCHKYSM